jgi:hypothetical protein
MGVASRWSCLLTRMRAVVSVGGNVVVLGCLRLRGEQISINPLRERTKVQIIRRTSARRE